MERLSSLRAAALAASLMLVVTACGTGRTLVMEPPAQKQVFTAVSLEHTPDTVTMPDEYRERLVTRLRQKLYGTTEQPGPFTEGPGLTLRLKVVQFDAGSQFSRWFWGGIGNAGEGSLQVLAEFYGQDKKLANIQTEGRIGSGFFGGSMNEAVDKAADEIGNYAAANFH